jgi:hypothetical protein
VVVSFCNPKGDSENGTFTVEANAEIPKSVNDDDVFESRLMRFAILPSSAGKPSVNIIKMGKLPE